MDYATKELTRSLQEISEQESKIRQGSSENSSSQTQRTYAVCGLGLPTGVDQFLQSRKEFQEKTRNVSVGNY